MATFEGQVGTLTDNGSTEVFTGRGVYELCQFSGDYGDGVVNTEMSIDNGDTWVETGDRFNIDVAFNIYAFTAKYRFTLSGAASPNISYYVSIPGVA